MKYFSFSQIFSFWHKKKANQVTWIDPLEYFIVVQKRTLEFHGDEKERKTEQKREKAKERQTERVGEALTVPENCVSIHILKENEMEQVQN